MMISVRDPEDVLEDCTGSFRLVLFTADGADEEELACASDSGRSE